MGSRRSLCRACRGAGMTRVFQQSEERRRGKRLFLSLPHSGAASLRSFRSHESAVQTSPPIPLRCHYRPLLCKARGAGQTPMNLLLALVPLVCVVGQLRGGSGAGCQVEELCPLYGWLSFRCLGAHRRFPQVITSESSNPKQSCVVVQSNLHRSLTGSALPRLRGDPG